MGKARVCVRCGAENGDYPLCFSCIAELKSYYKNIDKLKARVRYYENIINRKYVDDDYNTYNDLDYDARMRDENYNKYLAKLEESVKKLDEIGNKMIKRVMKNC